MLEQGIHFRAASGAADAPALLEVHEQCRAGDGADAYSLLEYRPTLDECRQELERTDPADWVIVEWCGRVVGYGHTLWDWAECDGVHVFLHLGWVSPAFCGRGIGSDLLRRLEARCRERAATTPAARYEYGANAAHNEPSAARLLMDNGYTPGYTVLEMEHDRACWPEHILLPTNYELRPALPEHHRAIWQSIGDAYDAAQPDGRFTAVPTEAAFRSYFDAACDPSLWFIAWYGSRIAGQVLCRIHEQCAEIYEVSVGAGHRRRGLARALLSHGLQALYQRNVRRIRLATIYENPTHAWRLYEQAGFQVVGRFPRWRKPLV